MDVEFELSDDSFQTILGMKNLYSIRRSRNQIVLFETLISLFNSRFTKTSCQMDISLAQFFIKAVLSKIYVYNK